MSVPIFLATNNAKKLAELRRIMAERGLDLTVSTPADLGDYPEPAETEWTFEGNALIKARAGVQHSGLPSIADDSGLCVDALGGMPGVRSSRWAGPQHDDVANLELVLRQIDDVEDPRRTARFVAAMALAMPDGREFTVRGEMAGHLLTEPHGQGGFGYDPIFTADDTPATAGPRPATTAELSADDKDAISHRGKALREMLTLLQTVLDIPLGAPAQEGSPR